MGAVDEPQSYDELMVHYGDAGPVAAAMDWIQLAVREERWRDAWPFMADALRLAGVQDWLCRNRERPDVARCDLEEAAAALACEQPRHSLWEPFETTQRQMVRESWPDGFDGWGAASRPRAVGLEHELVVFVRVDRPGEPMVFEQPTLVDDARVFTMCHTKTGWLVASLTDRLPEPGWPPTFWA